MALALVSQKGKNFSTQFDRMTMPSICQGLLSFALHPLEQPIDRRPMHVDCTANSCFLG